INLVLYPGELTAVIGINGAGKSTFLKTLTTDLPLKAGSLLLRNRPLQKLSVQSIAKHISIVLPNPQFSKNLTVFELVALGRHPYTNWLGLLTPTDKTAIREALDKIELTDLADRQCRTLSDGQLQKVFLARALAQDTEL